MNNEKPLELRALELLYESSKRLALQADAHNELRQCYLILLNKIQPAAPAEQVIVEPAKIEEVTDGTE